MRLNEAAHRLSWYMNQGQVRTPLETRLVSSDDGGQGAFDHASYLDDSRKT